ncbi:MAG: phosphoribosylformylglycinamidine synthase subunit PurQ [Gammaproteobacteria bacterium]
MSSGGRGPLGPRGLAGCGGFSYGDVLGAGNGWAKSILYNDRTRGGIRALRGGSWPICGGAGDPARFRPCTRYGGRPWRLRLLV